MKITIFATQNGWVIYRDEFSQYPYETPRELAARCWSFHSIEKAVGKVRELLKEHELQEAEKPDGSS